MNTNTAPEPQRVNWASVAIFYVTACLISWPLFWLRDFEPERWSAVHLPGSIKGLAPGFGPALAALLVLVIFRRTHRRTISLFGSSLPRSLLFVAIPVIGFFLVGLGDDKPHKAGLIFAGFSVVYCIFEEFGWRGFLQDALRPLPEKVRYPLLGAMWGTWHFTTFYVGTPLEIIGRLAWLYPLWIFGSWGIGRATDLTHSLLIAVMLHLILNFLSGAPLTTAGPVLAVSALCWAVLLKTWPRTASQPLNGNDR